MDTVLTTQIIDNAIGDVDKYKTTVDGLFSDLRGVLASLTPQDFEGDAANGYMTFFNTKVTPALTENVTALTDGLKKILDDIREQLMRTVDPKLGSFNENPSEGAEQ